jgi:hypothetical protein
MSSSSSLSSVTAVDNRTTEGNIKDSAEPVNESCQIAKSVNSATPMRWADYEEDSDDDESSYQKSYVMPAAAMMMAQQTSKSEFLLPSPPSSTVSNVGGSGQLRKNNDDAVSSASFFFFLCNDRYILAHLTPSFLLLSYSSRRRG